MGRFDTGRGKDKSRAMEDASPPLLRKYRFNVYHSFSLSLHFKMILFLIFRGQYALRTPGGSPALATAPSVFTTFRAYCFALTRNHYTHILQCKAYIQ